MGVAKSLYELKQDSIKTKYKKRISEIQEPYLRDKGLLSSEELHLKYDGLVKALSAEAEEEITSLKKERNAIVNGYQSKIRMNIILADILLVLGIAILTFGIYMKHKMDVNPKAIEILLIIFGSLIMVSAGIFFGSADHNRQKQHDYFTDSYSESELVSTKAMVREFVEDILEGRDV